jgi:hypothetical protein
VTRAVVPRRGWWLLAAACSVLVCLPQAAFAQGERYALVVQGSSGGDPFTTMHRRWLTSLVTTLRGPLGIEPSHVTVLAEQPAAGEQSATADNVRAALVRLTGQTKPADILFVMLIGHGGGSNADAKFNLIGPDLTIAEWNALLKPIDAKVAFVNSTGASVGFIKGLAAPGRLVITATRVGGEQYDTVFPEKFIIALTAAAADADKNGRISMLEAFDYASRLVKQHYEQAGTLATEHASFDDTGEGIARDAAVAGGSIGTIASLTYLDAPALPTSSNPEVQQLLRRQQTLTQQVDDLRRQRPSMTPAAYDDAFEKLILDLSLVSRDVRRRTGGS